MRILVIGNGGREHALAWRLSSCDNVTAIMATPSSPGLLECAICFDIKADDIDGIVTLVLEQKIDLVVVGPEIPLSMGLADRLRAQNIATFGPSQMAAQLESSKAFSKDFMARHNIPTAGYGVFRDADKAVKFLETLAPPYVLKASGLAAGKGVVIAQSLEEAKAEALEMLGGKFGAASNELVIEEFMHGEEASFFVLCNEKSVIPLPICQDHKRAFDNDLGPNTGGMGAYAPTSLVDEKLQNQIMQSIVVPTIEGMKKEDNPYNGVLYVGLMVDGASVRVVEYNCRFGDPECQILMQFMGPDFARCLMQIATNESAELSAWPKGQSAVTVVMAANGYPGDYEKGARIEIDQISSKDSMIFHAGTKKDIGGNLCANGGRVLNITAKGESIEEAIKSAYQNINKIHAPGLFYRNDIGARELSRKR